MADFVPGHISVNSYTNVSNLVTILTAQYAIEFIIDGGGAEITTGLKGYLIVPYKSIVGRITALADQVGDIQIDIYRVPIQNMTTGLPPTSSDSMMNGNQIIISGDYYYLAEPWSWGPTSLQNAGLLNRRDILNFNVDSVAGIQRVTIIIDAVIQ